MIAQVVILPRGDSSAKARIEDAGAVDQIDDLNPAWVDINQPDQQDIDWLRQRFNLHPMAARDIEHHRQRPKLDDYGALSFGVLYAVGAHTDKGPRRRLQMHEVQFLWTDAHFITIHWSPIPAIKELTERLRSGELKATVSTVSRQLSVPDLAYELCDAIVDGYFPALDSLAEASEDVEEEMFSTSRSSKTLQAIFSLKKDLFQVRKVVAPARDVMNVLLRRDHKLFSEEYFPYFQDLYDRTNRVIDGLDTYRDLLSTALDTYLSFVSNDVNQTVKRMTAVTAILMVDALIAGIYGMNFDNIPELHWAFGYAYSLVLMAGASLGLWVLFRRIRWF